jgi:hypothetical protein
MEDKVQRFEVSTCRLCGTVLFTEEDRREHAGGFSRGGPL